MENVRERFAEDTAHHTVDIRHDDGVYRHLVCSHKGRSTYRFDIVTYPGYLVVSGDMGDFVFNRMRDMFNFFRRSDGEINPGYWAEKCSAGTVEEFSKKTFENTVTDYVTDYFEDDKETVQEVMAAVREDVFGPVENGENPYACLDEFRTEGPDGEFIFTDTFELSFSNYTHRFLWVLHGIVWAINEYDRLKGVGATATTQHTNCTGRQIMFVPVCYNTRCKLCNAQLAEDLWATQGLEQYCDTCTASITHTPSQDVLLYGRPLEPFEEETT